MHLHSPIAVKKTVAVKKTLLFAVFLLCSSSLQAQSEAEITRAISKLAPQAPEHSLIRLYDSTGTIRFNHGELNQFVPASTLKIITALLALRSLGKDYRFTTPVYINDQQGLLIEGQGDPLLVSEELAAMAQSLVAAGIQEVDSIALDDSRVDWFKVPGSTDTDNPYDAANGGLIVNFNTVHVRKQTNGRVESAEPQTPLTAVAKAAVANRAAGTYRINLGQDRKQALRYSHQLIQLIFKNAGISVADSAFIELPSRKNAPSTEDSEGNEDNGDKKDNWKMVLEHSNSKNLEALVQLMLKYSNNFIANQIGLALSAGSNRTAPASLQQSLDTANAILTNTLGIDRNDLYIEEFSGISRNNRITADAMYRVLVEFKKYAHLLDTKNRALVKSGTLQGMYHYAGYLQIQQQLWPILIITYSKRNSRDHILQLMQSLAQILTNE